MESKKTKTSKEEQNLPPVKDLLKDSIEQDIVKKAQKARVEKEKAKFDKVQSRLEKLKIKPDRVTIDKNDIIMFFGEKKIRIANFFQKADKTVTAEFKKKLGPILGEKTQSKKIGYRKIDKVKTSSNVYTLLDLKNFSPGINVMLTDTISKSCSVIKYLAYSKTDKVFILYDYLSDTKIKIPEKEVTNFTWVKATQGDIGKTKRKRGYNHKKQTSKQLNPKVEKPMQDEKTEAVDLVPRSLIPKFIEKGYKLVSRLIYRLFKDSTREVKETNPPVDKEYRFAALIKEIGIVKKQAKIKILQNQKDKNQFMLVTSNDTVKKYNRVNQKTAERFARINTDWKFVEYEYPNSTLKTIEEENKDKNKLPKSRTNRKQGKRKNSRGINETSKKRSNFLKWLRKRLFKDEMDYFNWLSKQKEEEVPGALKEREKKWEKDQEDKRKAKLAKDKKQSEAHKKKLEKAKQERTKRKLEEQIKENPYDKNSKTKLEIIDKKVKPITKPTDTEIKQSA